MHEKPNVSSDSGNSHEKSAGKILKIYGVSPIWEQLSTQNRKIASQPILGHRYAPGDGRSCEQINRRVQAWQK